MLLPDEPERSITSSGRALLAVPQSWAFAVKAPQLWSSLPEDLRLAESVTSFSPINFSTLFILYVLFFMSPLIVFIVIILCCHLLLCSFILYYCNCSTSYTSVQSIGQLAANFICFSDGILSVFRFYSSLYFFKLPHFA